MRANLSMDTTHRLQYSTIVASLESAEGISNGKIRIMGLSDAESADNFGTHV